MLDSDSHHDLRAARGSGLARPDPVTAPSAVTPTVPATPGQEQRTSRRNSKRRHRHAAAMVNNTKRHQQWRTLSVGGLRLSVNSR